MGVALSVVSINIRMIPNEPLYFANDPQHRSWSGTSILAWTIMTYLEQGQDPLKLAHLPMTKACVRAMDTGAAIAKDKAGLNITKFIISGASKRGWAVWLAAAVDKRVIALSPIVYDLLSMIESLHHMYRAYGGWTFALKPFYKLNFTAELDTPQAKVLQMIIDPIKYTDRLTMPKLIIDTTGDEYFMLDNPHYYFNQLKGPTYIDTIANADHICVGHILEILFAQKAFFQHILNKNNSTKLTVFTDKTPKAVKAFRAITIDERRDFRLFVADHSDPMHKKAIHPVAWFQQPVYQQSPTEFWVENVKGSYWTGFFIQVSYHGVESDSVLEFTTPTQIVPDTFPFEDCHGTGCRGKIV
ncbi:autocrine proliferation repressor protein A-like isoform X2 [Gigantopelta aegis]|uniref:autocrine proliferation repressor protein A-like isoform X2 n=1 Tax=Gigantopelta aegis TaxID=1735272 RepID=UPI001B88CB0F|nr:autocrine proliferation repressor protein A-like isoform X2 [Gigantopelta aegis]